MHDLLDQPYSLPSQAIEFYQKNRFIKVFPRDYKSVLAKQKADVAAALK